MKTSGRCLVAIENKKGNLYQISLNETTQALVIAFIRELSKGKIIVNPDVLPIYLKKYGHAITPLKDPKNLAAIKP